MIQHRTPALSSTRPVLRSALAVAVSLALTGTATAGEHADAYRLDPVMVNAEAAESPTGPVEGYVAERSTAATKTDTLLQDTPQSISVIGQQQIRDQGALNVQDALRFTAGVRSEPYGLDSRGDWSLIRGSAPVIFQDGLQQTFGFYANVRPDVFTLERVEVLRGPASVLYGQGTVGGLVNLVTKRPQDRAHREVQGQLGSFDRRQATVDATGPVADDGSLLYRVVAVVRDSGTQVRQVPDDRYVLTPSLTWRPTEQIDWTLIANLQRDESGSTTQFLPHAGTVLPAPNGLPRIPIDVFMSEPGFDEYITEQQALTSLLTLNLNDAWTLRQNARYSRSSVSYQTLYPSFPPTLQDNGDIDRVYYVSRPDLKYLTVDNQAQVDFGSERARHTVLAGLDYQHATTDRTWAYGAATPLNLYDPVYGNFTPPGSGDFVTDPRNTVEQLGVYLQDQILLDERWITVLGLRHDRSGNRTAGGREQKDDALTRRAALMYKADNGMSPYVSYTESFQPIIGLDAQGRQFEPLRGAQYEVGIKYQPPGSDSLFTLTAYDLREKNRRMPDPDNPMNQVQSGEVRVQGLEFEALMAVTDRWDLIGTYAYTDSEVVRGDPATQGRRLASVPEHMASLWSLHRFSIGDLAGFRAGGGIRYVSDSWDGTDSLKTPGYSLYDAMLGYQSGPWSATLTVNNLADKTYYTTCLARGDCFVGSKRTILGTVSYRF